MRRKLHIVSIKDSFNANVQYCQLDSIGKNRSSIRPISSICISLAIFNNILGPGWKLFYLIDSFYLVNREFFRRSDKQNCLSAICISLATLKNISRYSGTRVEASLFARFVLFGEQRIFQTIRQVKFSICHLHLISETYKYFTIFLEPGRSLSV